MLRGIEQFMTDKSILALKSPIKFNPNSGGICVMVILFFSIRESFIDIQVSHIKIIQLP
jgi:hypothetical protein